MFAWCEYYTTQPSRVLHEPYEPMVGCGEYPCWISGKLLTDEDIENRSGVVSAMTFWGDEALLTYDTQGLRMPEHEKFEIRLKIIPVAWLYQ